MLPYRIVPYYYLIRLYQSDILIISQYYNYRWFTVASFNFVLMELKISYCFVFPKIDMKPTEVGLIPVKSIRSTPMYIFFRVSLHVNFFPSSLGFCFCSKLSANLC